MYGMTGDMWLQSQVKSLLVWPSTLGNASDVFVKRSHTKMHSQLYQCPPKHIVVYRMWYIHISSETVSIHNFEWLSIHIMCSCLLYSMYMYTVRCGSLFVCVWVSLLKNNTTPLDGLHL